MNPIRIFIFVLATIKCDEEKSTIENNDLFLFLTNDGYLHAFEKKDKNEKWKILFGNDIIPKNINSHNIDEDNFLYSINSKLYIFKNNNMIPFDIFVKELSNINSINDNNCSIEGKIKTTYYIIDLKTGKILEKSSCFNGKDDKDDTVKKLTNNEIILKKVDYILLKNNNKKDNVMNISYSEIDIESENNEISLLENINKINIVHDLINYFKINF